MFSFLGFIFIIILVILLFGVSIISSIVRTIFGGRRSTPNSNQSRTYNQSNNTQGEGKDTFNDSRNKDRKKVFDKEDGEYVDFEEIKEDK